MALQSAEMRSDPQLQSAANNQPPLRQGSQGSGVKILQRCLIRVGFAMPVSTCQGNRDPDGIYGEETRAVVSQFQRREGLSADGIAGRDTLHRLDQLQPAAAAATGPSFEPPRLPTDIMQAKDHLVWRMVCHWT